MGAFRWKEEWVDILEQQEQVLRYDRFTREMALELGLDIVKLAGETYGGGAAVRIVEDNMVIFAYKMPGASLENDWWMDKKLAVSRRTGTSSLRAYVQSEAGLREPFWEERPNNFAACGGCFPVLPKDGSAPWAYVLVSGLHHHEDHQVIAAAMSRQLGKPVDEVVL